jgi:hypothetical protein
LHFAGERPLALGRGKADLGPGTGALNEAGGGALTGCGHKTEISGKMLVEMTK